LCKEEKKYGDRKASKRMVFLVSRLNKVAGPFLLRHGLALRYRLGGGIIRDNPTLDAFLLLPLSQKLISLEIEQESSATLSSSVLAKGPSAIVNEWTDKTFDSVFGKDKEERKAVTPEKNTKSPLERYLRPILVPNERWSDVGVWRFHSRFIKWARAEYLQEAHGTAVRVAFQKNPKLRQGPQISMGNSSSDIVRQVLGAAHEKKGEVRSATLPTTDTLIRAFGMQKWNRKGKDSDAIWNRMTELASELGGQVIAIPGTSLRFADLPEDLDTSKLAVEDILDLVGGHVASCGPLNVLCEECNIYQLWSKEYIAGLAEYLVNRQSSPGKTLVLDVGAGDGLLARLLKEHFQPKRTAPDILAVDDGSWGISPKTNDVEKLKFTDAIEKYAADYEQIIVLCSWMPMGDDWTASFRKAGVKEYILIGESDDGNCGCNWETWGNPEFCEDDAIDDTVRAVRPAYEADSYKRFNLSTLTPFQFSRFDSADSANSATISFRKL
jgi:hypothetical protein